MIVEKKWKYYKGCWDLWHFAALSCSFKISDTYLYKSIGDFFFSRLPTCGVFKKNPYWIHISTYTLTWKVTIWEWKYLSGQSNLSFVCFCCCFFFFPTGILKCSYLLRKARRPPATHLIWTGHGGSSRTAASRSAVALHRERTPHVCRRQNQKISASPQDLSGL